MLSTIFWENRGQASDNFDALFGAGAPAEAARAVVDAAIDAWEEVVVDFNHAAGVTSPSGYDLDLTLSMNLGNNGCGASTSTTIGSDGKPIAGSQSFGSCGANGSGWFIDPTPNDHSEFAGTINNAFTGQAQAGSPAAGLSDFYSIVLAELTHNMGICNSGCGSARYNDSGFWVDTGIADDTPQVAPGPGNFFVFQGPTIDALMTNNNGGSGGSAATNPLHTAEARTGNSSITFGGVTAFGADDNGNCCGGGTTRTLVSNRTALILKDSYDYDIVMPETFGSMYAILNEMTGQLTIRGGADNTQVNGVNQGPSDDVISIVRDGDRIVVSVDIGNDVPGTGTNRTVNDAQDAFVTIFPTGQVLSIVVQAGGGDDTISAELEVGVPLTIDPGTGNDRVFTGGGPATVASVDDDGNDLIDFSKNPLGINFTVNGSDSIIGTNFNDVLTVDTSNGLAGLISFDGRGGQDRIIVTGTGNFTNESLFIGATPGSGRHVLDSQTLNFENIEPFTSNVAAVNFNVSATPGLASLLDAANAVTYTDGLILAGGGRVTVDDFEPIEFNNKTNVSLSLGNGDDSFFGNVFSASADLARITVDGGNGHDLLTFVQVPAAAIGGFDGVTANGGLGDDRIDASAVAVNTPFFMIGGRGNDVLIGGRGDDFLTGDDGDDTLAGGDPALTPLIGDNGYSGGDGFDTLLVLGTLANDSIVLNQTGSAALTATINLNTSSESLGVTLEQVHVQARQGNDLVRVMLSDQLTSNVQRYYVQGDAPNASDRLIVTDEGLGDLVLLRQGPDARSGRVSVAPGAAIPPPEIVYEGIERLDVLPVDPVTGGTGAGGGGQIKSFHNDPFEFNDNRLTAGQLARVPESATSPVIDPGGLTDPFGDGTDVPGDEDWYEFRPQATGTFRVKILFDTLAAVPSGRPGLPGAGDLQLDIYDANGALIVSGVAAPGGKAADFAATNDPAFPEFNRIFVRVRGATADSINVYDFDDLAGLATSNPGVGDVDIFGPQVTDVTINDLTTAEYNLFGIKPGNAAQGPTPLVDSLVIHLQDLPPRVAGFLYPALDYELTPDQARGLFEVKGDANGIVSIASVEIVNPFPLAVGEIPAATVRLVFAQPLPDDRFTLTIDDSLRDPAENRLDGESNADEPNTTPFFPSGDGNVGGAFVARFTVDSRAELGVYSSGSIYVDTNGNFTFDPTNADFTNRDITYLMGFTSDNNFAGNFAPAGAAADGFHKLAAYGKVGTAFRFLIDTDNDGVVDITQTQPLFAGVTNVNGMPAAGNFDGNAANGDEVVLKVGNTWLIDTNHDFRVDLKLPGTNMIGLPIVGDFDGDGIDDLGAWADNTFRLNLSTLGAIDGTADRTFTFGFASTRERPVAADFDGDGIDDLGLWVPDRSGAAPHESAEWYLLISGGQSIVARLAAGGGVISFEPTPFGNDHFAQFGDEFGLPVVGNFDPPLTSAADSGGHTNLQDPLDVNNDGSISPLDALLIVNLLNSGAPTQLAEPSFSGAPFLDVNQDGHVSAIDALLVVNWLNAQPPAAPEVPPDDGDGNEGEGEAVSADAYFAQLAAIADEFAVSTSSRRSRHR